MKDQILNSNHSLDLLKALHILTQDGKLNQDSRRKLKQVQHLFQFIEPILKKLSQNSELLSDSSQKINLIDHGAGKSYLGFILYDLYIRFQDQNKYHLYSIETRKDLIQRSQELAKKLNFNSMSFLNLSVSESLQSKNIPENIHIVTALHACDTATDDAIHFGLKKNVPYIVVVPCCQAEVATALKNVKNKLINQSIVEIFRHSLHTREFGSHLTNILRCLQLEAFGYKVTVTELVGFEHSMKNEIIIAEKVEKPRPRYADKLSDLLHQFSIHDQLQHRFLLPDSN